MYLRNFGVMRYRHFKELLIFLVSFCAYIGMAKSACPGDFINCNGDEICYPDERSEITADDAMCMVRVNPCNKEYRSDTCNICDLNPSQYDQGSQYKDCMGECYTPETKDEMKLEDKCGVCDGDNSSCDPLVTELDCDLIPARNGVIFTVFGNGFNADNLRIVLLSEGLKPHVPKNPLNLIVGTLAIVRIYNATAVDVETMEDISPGSYEVGAQINETGTEFVEHKGPRLEVYSEIVTRLLSISLDEQDIDGTADVSVTLGLSPERGDTIKNYFDITNQFTCIVRDQVDTRLDDIGDSEVAIAGVFSEGKKSLDCDLDVPDVSSRKWICVSFNKKHIIGCQNITFFEVAPKSVDDIIRFDGTGVNLYVDFDKKVNISSDSGCSAYFEDIAPLGRRALCRISGDKRRLSVSLGDAPTININDTLVLKAGLEPEGEFVRATDEIILTVAGVNNEKPGDGSGDGDGDGEGGDDDGSDSGPVYIVIAPYGAWKTLFTSLAESTMTFEIQILQSPGSRGAQTITWSINENVIESAADRLELVQPLPAEEGTYEILVKAWDFLGGSYSLRHSFQKINLDLPDVSFFPVGVRELTNGQFEIHPNSLFIINTRIAINTVGGFGGVDDYVWTWKKEGEPLIQDEMYYESTREETTIDMCDQTVRYSLSVAPKTDISNELESDISFIVKCRKPFVMISGSRETNVDIAYGTVDVYAMSYDRDGGLMKYTWSCQTLTVTEEDCIQDIVNTEQDTITSSTVSLDSNRMTAGKSYKLIIKGYVEKSGQNYTSTDNVVFNAKSGENLVTRIVTIRNKFREDTPIMVKAHVGKDIHKLKWKFVDGLADYDWLDATNITIGKHQHVDEYSWYTIYKDMLTPGRKYQLNLEATTLSGLNDVISHDVYVYRVLRGCEVEARNIVEMQTSYLSLRYCLHDPDVTWLTMHCKVGLTEIHLSRSYKFMTPIFPRSKTKAIFTCMVTDSLGYMMSIESNEVTITKTTTEERDRIQSDLAASGKHLEALQILADRELTEDMNDNIAFNTAAVGLIESIATADEVDYDQLRRALLSYSQLEVDHIRPYELGILVRNIKRIVSVLCSLTEDSTVNYLSESDIQAVLDTTAVLVETSREHRTNYTFIENKLTCIKFKRMRNEDIGEVNFYNDSTTTYVVNTLDDVQDFGVRVDFPEELRSQYRDIWKCTESSVCHGVGLRVAKFNKSEPPSLLFGRADKECSDYREVDLFNHASGKRIKVKDLTDVINIEFDGESCPRAECWYYDTFLQRFKQNGIFTNIKEDGTLQCQSIHLTTFTLRSGPKKYEGRNLPYIVSVSVGSVLFVVSIVVHIKAFCTTKRRANAIEDVKRPLPSPDVTDSPPPPFHFKVNHVGMRQPYH